MTPVNVSNSLARRLPWLLVFRGAVATGLFVLTLAADIANWQVRLMSIVLYGVVVLSYLVVLVLGMLLRAGSSPVIISTVHLSTTVMAAMMVVQATGGVESGFSFLYLLIILDGAIIGGRRVALVMATSATLTFGLQLVLQLYGIFSAGLPALPPASQFVSAVVIHLAAFYLTALLAGHLAHLLESARAAVTSAQTDLHRVEAFHTAVLSSLPVGVITVDGDMRVCSANVVAERILGGGGETLVGQLVPESLRAAWNTRSVSTEIAAEIRGQCRLLSTSRSRVHPEAEPLEGQSAVDVVVIEDRTEIQELQNNLRKKERLALVGEMAAAIAHELRNPLAAISGSVELMHSGGSSGAQEKLESIVRREIDRLNVLVDDFLRYARPTPLQPVTTDLAQLIRDLAAVLAQDPAWKEHSLQLSLPVNLSCEVDPGQVRQMLWNLLRNACEASPGGAPIELTGESTGAGDDAAVTVCIRDYGTGVEPHIRNRVFEPFKTTKSHGSGLGLAVVQRIVLDHRGTVRLVSPPSGAGTCAVVRLPAKRPQPASTS